MNNTFFHQNVFTNDTETNGTRGIVFIIVESCIFIILNLAALFGNALVCLAFYRNAALRRVPHHFVLSLALTDLAMAIFVMPLSTSSSIANRWSVGLTGCHVRYFFAHSLSATSLATLMLLAINRYFLITRPVLYRVVYSKKRSLIMILASWLVPIIGVILLFFSARIHFRPAAQQQPADCFLFAHDTNGLIAMRVVRILWITVPSLVVVLCYVKIFQAIRQHNMAVAQSPQLGSASALGVDETKMTRTLTAVVIAFYLSWSPVLLSNFLEQFKVISETFFKYYNFYYSFPYFISSVVNPIIYAIMSRQFRREFEKILRLT